MDWPEAAAIVIIGGIAAVATGGLLAGAEAFAVDYAVTGAVVAGATTSAVIEGSEDDWQDPVWDYYT